MHWSNAVAEHMFVVWLKIMDFVTQNDESEPGNKLNLSHSKNVLQTIVSHLFTQNFSFSLTTIREPSNLHNFSLFSYSHRLLWCQDTMVFDFQS